MSIHLFLFLFNLLLVKGQVTYDSTKYTLGPNLLANSLFSSPTVPSNYNKIYANNSILGWKCNKTCEVLALYRAFSNRNLTYNFSSTIQGVDLDSQVRYDRISQWVSIRSKAFYLAYLEWMDPVFSPYGKKARIKIGNNTIFDITSTIQNNSRFLRLEQTTIQLQAGNYELIMQMYGNSPDGTGIIIHRIEVYQAITIPIPTITFQTLLNQVLLNNANKIINKIPGNRIVFSFVASFLSIFDRLYLYYFHHQNNTYYAETFLKQMYDFNQNKSGFCQLIFQTCADTSDICKTVYDKYEYLSLQLNQKYNYTSADFLAKNDNGIGFFANHLDLIYFEVPFAFLEVFLLYLVFRLLFRYKVSIFFRKFSLLFIILFLLFEGNIQEFAFYLFNQLKYFFSANFVHKIGNSVILFILFVLITFSIGGLLWLNYHYKKLVKYFIQYYSSTLIGLAVEAFERQLFPLLFGFIHAFFLQSLELQSILLTIAEVLYFLIRIVSLRSLRLQQKLKVSCALAASFLRIIFIQTFYLFQNNSHLIINIIHRDLFIVYMGLWAFETSLNFVKIILESILTLRKKVTNQPSKNYMKPSQTKASEERPKRRLQINRSPAKNVRQKDMKVNEVPVFEITSQKQDKKLGNDRPDPVMIQLGRKIKAPRLQ